MKPKERINQLENLLKQQQEELAQLRKEVADKNEPDLRPYGSNREEGWKYSVDDSITRKSNLYPSEIIDNYARYPIRAMAEWQGKRERAIRKLQHLAVRLNPKGWKPSPSTSFFVCLDGGERSYYEISFHSSMAREIAEKEMGDDLKYLNWYNSPEAKGEGV